MNINPFRESDEQILFRRLFFANIGKMPFVPIRNGRVRQRVSFSEDFSDDAIIVVEENMSFRIQFLRLHLNLSWPPSLAFRDS